MTEYALHNLGQIKSSALCCRKCPTGIAAVIGARARARASSRALIVDQRGLARKAQRIILRRMCSGGGTVWFGGHYWATLYNLRCGIGKAGPSARAHNILIEIMLQTREKSQQRNSANNIEIGLTQV